jgi:hypothetical protein
METCGERWWEPELLRSKGELLRESGANVEEAREFVVAAYRLALERRAAIFQLRAAVSLSTFSGSLHGRAQAVELVRQALGTMSEGAETLDVAAAHAVTRGRE